MKVLHVGEYMAAGVATLVNDLLSYQLESAEIKEVYLLLGAQSAETRFVLDQGSIFFYEFSRKSNNFIKAMLQIRKTIKMLQPDIIHAHSSYAGFFVRAPYLFSHRRPGIVYCAHGWSFNREVSLSQKKMLAAIERVLARATDVIINISQYDQTTSRLNKLPAEKMVLIYNGVNEEETDGRPDLNLDKNCINLLFAGRFDRQKGLDILLKVFGENEFDKVRLYLAGKRILGDLNVKVPPEVVNLGWIPHDIIDSYYRQFDAVVVPSRWEGFGLVAIEALKNAKAVIASNRCSLPEIVSHGVNGYLYRIEDLKELVGILRGLDRGVLEDMGKRGYEIYRQKFNSLMMNKKVLEVYRKLFHDRKKNN